MEINVKLHAILKTKWLSLSHLLLQAHSPSWHPLAQGRLSPPAWPPPPEARPQTTQQGQQGWVENTDPEKNQNCRCSLLYSISANQSTPRLLQCRYTQASIYFCFQRTINLIHIALTTNKFCRGYEQLHVQHPCKLCVSTCTLRQCNTADRHL